AVRQVYGLAGLDVAETPALRLQAKKSMGQNGQRGYTFGQQNKALIWCELADLRLHLRQDVNANQIARLSAADRAAFLAEAGEVMAALGYEPDAPMPVRAAAADVERAGVSRLRQAQAAAVNEETR
ncbi:MAG: hypothetical protein KC425_02600, partial [Anaerolineales bacterium]|nr:hypothetical protein [Anaerolineales bacterium]